MDTSFVFIGIVLFIVVLVPVGGLLQQQRLHIGPQSTDTRPTETTADKEAQPVAPAAAEISSVPEQNSK